MFKALRLVMDSSHSLAFEQDRWRCCECARSAKAFSTIKNTPCNTGFLILCFSSRACSFAGSVGLTAGRLPGCCL
eukprot:7152666-Heterocapsa_arctica.AAC.1